MNRRTGKRLLALLLLAVAGNTFSPLPLAAQEPSERALRSAEKEFSAVAEKVQSPQLKKQMEDLKKADRKKSRANRIKLYNAFRVAEDLALRQGKEDYAAWNRTPFVYYTVPALSNIPRIMDSYPVDGVFAGTLEIVAARDEFEPASFVLYPFVETEKLELKAENLKTADGKVFPAENLDLKVVKVWYQNSNSWYNYFGDFTRKLVPELLLNDENLITIDTETQDNYLRADYPSGSRLLWISAPEQIDPGFNSHVEPVSDAEKLLPVRLHSGEFKQFWLTVHVPENTAPGLYSGNIVLSAEGKETARIPVRLRVLPFVLPDPKTNYDLSADFYTMLYCVPGSNQYYNQNGYDQKLSDKKALARLIDQKNHNVTSPLYMGLWKGYSGFDDVVNSIALAKKAGMRMDPFFEAFYCGVDANDPQKFLDFKRNLSIAKKEFQKLLGHSNLYPAGGEEPGYNHFIRVRNSWKHVQEEGMKVLCNGGDRRHFAGYNDDLRVDGGFADQERARFMHDVKGKIGNYAGPHTGPENPDYMRRMHGMNLYKKDYDMMYNYGYHEGGWNDFHTSTYRNMCLVYYTRDGVIDTLAWEGIREGIDDIRYATLLKQLAEQAIAKGGIERVYAARKGLQFLALMDEESVDLNTARLEMIRHILNIASHLNEGDR